MIRRIVSGAIQENFFKKKAILLLGPRQVGKTTLLRQLAETGSSGVLYLNCDEPDVREDLQNTTSTALRVLLGDKQVVFIDEAQRVPGIGLTLKLLVDQFPDVQVIATGSSALELAGGVQESLAGRKFEYHLYPLSTAEMVAHTSRRDEQRLLEQRLIYGLYPEIVNHPAESARRLLELVDGTLYKDALALQDVRKPAVLQKLLVALALQVGSEISYYELGQTVGTDPVTVERYITLLEQSYVLFQVGALSRNLRNELKKSKKVYFYDNGIRNALIKNFNPLALRNDSGALWENFMISERIKFNHYAGLRPNYYFWRTHAQQEIDWIEEANGQLLAIEFKWNAKAKARIPNTFLQAYPDATPVGITPENYLQFLI
ncbi:ATP-binding protein [Nibrella saemangeumensis]|uniref:ATP-binding protein n=1 Tax=Nibrella saemangeumensis TaxID=1084526 RepID=A0ABP8NGW9_9BACT